ncbi:hypothetical protein niasHT_040093 [Heterodera trifolii]|uniref:Uncharacterized protein n=1 Tax=Heterodera trifolii TaxID=157864 RepID=A0ABD2J3Q6_9BILA
MVVESGDDSPIKFFEEPATDFSSGWGPAQTDSAGQPYSLDLVGLKLYCKKVSLMDGLALELAKKLEMKPARYAVRKTMMKALFISPGRYECNANLFMDQVPRRVTMGLVANSDYHFNVRELSVVANGRSYPQAPYDIDYENWKFVRPYNDTQEALGISKHNNNNKRNRYFYCVKEFFNNSKNNTKDYYKNKTVN